MAFQWAKASPRELELGFEPVAAPTSRITDTLISQLTLADSVFFLRVLIHIYQILVIWLVDEGNSTRKTKRTAYLCACKYT